MDYSTLLIKDYVTGIKSGTYKAVDAVRSFIDKCKNDKHNAVLEVFDSWKTLATEVDKKVAAGQDAGILAGVPVIIKDNILYKGHKTTAGSRMLRDFVSPYTSTVVQKLIDAGAIIIARANMDEFACGTTGDSSAWGATKNAVNQGHSAGGSSSGCAVAVALGYCLVAIGTDSAGSIRLPSAFNGVVGVKPSLGLVSRFGTVALAGDLDHIGPLAKTVDDCKVVLEVISGYDKKDALTWNKAVTSHEPFTAENVTIGRVKQFADHEKSPNCAPEYYALLEKLARAGAKIVDVSVEHIEKSLAVYRIVGCAAIASNMSRFDGVRFTSASIDPDSMIGTYVKTRSENFGTRVKQRILFGNFVLQKDNFNKYFVKAKQVQGLIKKNLEVALKGVDCVIMPTFPKIAPMTDDKVVIGNSNTDDIFLVPANIAGIPAISVPYAMVDGLALGAQVICAHNNEATLFEIAKIVEGVCK
jgi:aspartyl-tRNA(Asn)/glutamyl-tRNA(Gln) amidotransferase subunit A